MVIACHGQQSVILGEYGFKTLPRNMDMMLFGLFLESTCVKAQAVGLAVCLNRIVFLFVTKPGFWKGSFSTLGKGHRY